MRTRYFCISTLGAILFFSTPASASEIPTQKAQLILEQSKAAMGGEAWDRVQVWHETGNYQSPNGVALRYESRADFPHLRFRSRRWEGSSNKTTIYDGSGFWYLTDSKLDSKDVSIEAATSGRDAAYMTTFAFFFPDRFPANFTYEGMRAEKDAAYDVIKVIPKSGSALEVWIDQKTHFIVHLIENGQTITLRDYRHVDGMWLSFTQLDEGGEYKVQSIQFEPLDPSLFSAPSH